MGNMIQYYGFETFKESINTVESFTVFMAKDGDETFLVISAQGGKSGADLGFNGTSLGDGKFKAPLNHENAEVLRKLFPFTAPVRGLSKPKSFGLGDRLGIATPGHISLFKKKDVFPIFAQQSIRELNLTNRTYKDVMDAASFAVFREGYKQGFGADGDHLKTAEDVEYALSLGFTMITLDCSEYIKNDVTADNAPPLAEKYAGKYLGKNFGIGEGISLVFEEAELRQCAAIYGDAIGFAADMYKRFLANGSNTADGKTGADFEISIDETASVTTPLQHFFVARELLDAGVLFATIAPRFCGEFQKGIDYKGDISQFENEIKVHAAIARHFGYKLSIHSGSDKFSVFPSIGRETRGHFHVKTAGTSWLEAMLVVAMTDPSLYREIHKFALSAFNEAAKYYHVTTDLSKIPDVSGLKDEELPKLFEYDDARQLIHITYGLILGLKDPNGSFIFKDRLYKLWMDNEDVYREALFKHIGKHLELLEAGRLSK
ncbi:MAG: tagaturonate epimerase family protein [Treponema sp.]|nr:tagaturonate epimerase family protein [Treponema sp.]